MTFEANVFVAGLVAFVIGSAIVAVRDVRREWRETRWPWQR